MSKKKPLTTIEETQPDCCGTCRFYYSFGSDGVCRRFPPTIQVNEVYGCWPQITPDEWCGEWRAKEMFSEEQLSKLSPRERELVKLRHGLDGGERYTERECAGIFRMTQARTRQIYEKAMLKMGIGPDGGA